MVDNLYTRQGDLGLTIPSSITVAGVGGVGSWVAILAAMSGVKTLYLFDPDMMEESNRNRLPFCQGGINRPKVEVVKEYICSIRPDAIVIAIPEKLEGLLLKLQISVSEAIIECTDSPKAQFTIYNACKEANRLFIRAGYDRTHITVTSAISGWIKTDVEEEDYSIAPSWVVPAVTVAALAVGKLEKFFAQEVSLDINEIGIPVLQKRRRLTSRCKQEQGTAGGTDTRRRTELRRALIRRGT